MTTIAIAILSLNEEKRIARAIASAAFADQIIVVDSGSTDKTVQIAEKMGAHVYIEPEWQGFAVQRNRALSHITCDYVFFLDADEEITSLLKDEIIGQVQMGQDAIWKVRWEQIAFGQSLRRMTTTGGIERMFKRSSIKQFEGVVHEGAVMHRSDLPVVQFQTQLLHYSRETVYESLQKLAQYSYLGALKRKDSARSGGIFRGIGSGLGAFIRLYILRRGFLCGGAGFLFCFFVALECFFRYTILKYDSNHLTKAVKR